MTTNQYGSEYDQYIDGHYTDNRKPQDENLLNKVELTKDEIYKETKEKQLKELREKYNYRYTYIQEEIKSRFYDPGASSQQDYYRLLQTEYAQSLIIDFVIRQNSKEGIKKVFSTDNPNLVAEAKQINTNYGDVIEDAYNCIAGDNGIVTQNGVDSKLWKDLTKNGTDRETMDVDNISSIQIEVQYNRTDEQEVCENETTTADVKETTTSKNNVRIKKDKNSSENSFVRLLHHSKKARGNFDIIDVWFFESMEETTAIADLVDLLKYLFYLVYNKDYGVSTDEKDYIDLFNPGNFKSVSGTSTLEGTDTESIYNYLIGQGLTNAGAAGVMGNLEAESGFLADSVESWFLYGEQYRIDYTAKVNSGEISRYDFIYNGPNGNGYGLAGFTWTPFKEALYDYTIGRGKRIDDLELQLEFLMKTFREQFPSLYNTLTTSNDLYTCTYAMLSQYENPAVYNINDRYSNAQKYYK